MSERNQKVKKLVDQTNSDIIADRLESWGVKDLYVNKPTAIDINSSERFEVLVENDNNMFIRVK